MTELSTHGTRWGMRLMLFVLSFAMSSLTFASQPIVGTVERGDTAVFLQTGSRCTRYSIITKSADASINLNKLSTGDSLTATGHLNDEKCVAIVESVDYVGLKKMLGHWYSKDGIISVKDFSLMSFYPVGFKDFKNGNIYSVINPINYLYSVTPSNGREWVLFLSDSKSTTFATIQFLGNTATLRVYDSDTGAIKKTLYMSKWGSRK